MIVRRASSEGFALPLVLVLIMVLTIALVSLLAVSRNDASSSRGYARGIQAQFLANLAIDDVVADLRTEIGRYEVARRAQWQANPDTLDMGLFPAQVLPGLAAGQLKRTAHPVLRVSSSDPAYVDGFATNGISAPTNRASEVNSVDDAAMNNRRILPARWRATGLIPDDLATGLDWPDWIYVTRGGSQALTAGDLATARQGSDPQNAGQVIGRYGYVLFDVSGLLDVNVAGAVPDVDPGTKGGTHFARLGTLLGEDRAEDFLLWRHADAASGPYAERLYGDEETLGDIGRQRMGEASPDSNQLFARQDLLEMKSGSGILDGLPDDALWKLRTWSAASPAPDDVRVYDEAAGEVRRLSEYVTNGDLLVPHFDPDGTRADYTIRGSVGFPKPRFARRFSLARLRWLAAADGTLDAAIRQHFGLQRSAGLTVDGATPFTGWIYTSPDGTTPVTRIKSLSEITAREPDFFEWLKAAIDPGSLGVSGGNTSLLGQGVEDGSRDLQILRIGANLIDQADEDDVPTALYTEVVGGTGDVVLGVENLPFINELIWSFHREGELEPLDFYARFELWNPHRNSLEAPTVLPEGKDGNTLTQYRVRFTRGGILAAVGKAMQGAPGNLLMYSSYLGNITPSRNRYLGIHGAGVEPTAFLDLPAAGSLAFTLPNAATGGPGLYQEPALVAGINRSTEAPLTPQQPKFHPGDAPNNHVLTGGLRIGSLNLPARAINPGWSGDTLAPPGMITLSGSNFTVSQVGIKRFDEIRFFFDGADSRGTREPATVVLEVLADGQWRPVQMIEEIREITPKADAFQAGSNQTAQWTVDHADTASNSFYGWNGFGAHKGIFKIDPRTPRWGVSSTTGGSAGRSLRVNLNPLTFVTDAPETAPWEGSDWFFPGQDRSPTNVNAQGADEVPGWTINRAGTAGRRSGMAPWLVANDSANEYHYEEPRLLGSVSPVTPRTDYHALWNSTDFPTIPGSRARPVMLNRPFRSIGEMGFAFRDTPWRTLDFFNPDSGDYGLAGVFTIEGGSKIKGRINPLTAPAEVIEAVMAGVQRDAWDADAVSDAEITATVSAMDVLASGTTQPADIGRLLRSLNEASGILSGTGPKITKTRGEAVARALADASDLRTWNLLLDLIVQAGDLPGGAASLQNFHVTAERRYWVHLAIDRLTGDLVDMRIEPRSD